jgi:hypothetical protein
MNIHERRKNKTNKLLNVTSAIALSVMNAKNWLFDITKLNHDIKIGYLI